MKSKRNDNGKIVDAYKSIYVHDDTELKKYRRFYEKNPAAMPYPIRYDFVSQYLHGLDYSIMSPIGESSVPLAAFNHPHSLTDEIRRREYDIVYVDEAVRNAVDIDKFREVFKMYCRTHVDEEFLSITSDEFDKSFGKTVPLRDYFKYGESNPYLVIVALPVRHSADVDAEIGGLSDSMYFFGWNFSYAEKSSTTTVAMRDGGSEIVDVYLISFEQKYHDDVFELPDTLYHVTPVRYLSKIMKRGLVPLSKSAYFKYDNRIYLFRSDNLQILTTYGLNKVTQLKRNASKLESKYVNNAVFAILEIKREKLEKYPPFVDKRMVFYLDPCYDGTQHGGIKHTPAIFTYENIPSSLIEDYCYIYTTTDTSTDMESRKRVKLSDYAK